MPDVEVVDSEGQHREGYTKVPQTDGGDETEGCMMPILTLVKLKVADGCGVYKFPTSGNYKAFLH